MVKGRTGGLGKGLDALLTSTANETMQKPPTPSEQTIPNIPEIGPIENSKPNKDSEGAAQPIEEKKPARIHVHDEELEAIAAIERASAEKNNEQGKEEPSVKSPGWTQQEHIVEISEEAVESAPVIERVPLKKPTKRTAASESAKEKTAAKVNQSDAATQIQSPQPEEREIAEHHEDKQKDTRKLNEDSEIVPWEAIRPNPNQPRMKFNEVELDELAASIERDGLLQPILVRPVGEGKYEIIAGERRWQACGKAGIKEVPVRIKQADDVLALELALIENIQRSDLNPIEEAYGYRRIMEHKKITQSQLAQMVSKGRSTIANALRLLDLPEDAQQLLYEEKITSGHARAILSVPTAEGRQKLTEKLVSEKLSVRETENIARLYAGREKKEKEGAKRTATPKEFKMVARQLRTKLETSVQVKTVQGKNKIVIEFQDNEDLERLYKIISGE